MTTQVMRQIVKIDEELCDGCGLCVPSCAEGAIQIVDGKAKLVADNLCDGLGACLGTCPQDAITIEERPAEEFDHNAVERHLDSTATGPTSAAEPAHVAHGFGCPGSMLRRFSPAATELATAEPAAPTASVPSRLGQWPVQLALVPPVGDVWHEADVLIAADCVPFAMPDFHERLLNGKTLAVACPKLDAPEPYLTKLTGIFSNNRIRSVTVVRIEVPCCGGLTQLVQMALERAGSDLRPEVITISVRGEILEPQGAGAAPFGPPWMT